MLLYTGWLIRQSRNETAAVQQEFARESDGRAKKSAVALLLQIGSITGGLALLALGARWLVDGAVANAKLFGVSDLTIGLTIVAAGTSLPEVATSVLASIKGERGGLFLAYNAAYTAYLVLAATNEAISQTFGGIMLGFIVPLTVVTPLIGVARGVRSSPAPGSDQMMPPISPTSASFGGCHLSHSIFLPAG